MDNAPATPRLRLVGGLFTGLPGGRIPFLLEMFASFPRVKHAVPQPRQIQFASGENENFFQFMGVEVDLIEEIPEGMMAWDMDGDSWQVLQTSNGHTEVLWRETVNWKWLDQSVADRPCGEFSAKCPASWKNGTAPARREFRILAHSYLGAPVRDEIFLADYDPSWPEKYERMKQTVLERLGPEVALRVEHFGSTAIPAMPAKPVIDILVEIPSWEAGRKHAIPAFNSAEIEYWYYRDMCFIVRDKLTGIRTHHLHMAPADHVSWEALAFRDYLRSHVEDAARYVALKIMLARQYPNDREAYTIAKESFVREITDKAKAIANV